MAKSLLNKDKRYTLTGWQDIWNFAMVFQDFCLWKIITKRDMAVFRSLYVGLLSYYLYKFYKRIWNLLKLIHFLLFFFNWALNIYMNITKNRIWEIFDIAYAQAVKTCLLYNKIYIF